MSWAQLGTLVPAYDWQSVSTLSSNANLFRVRQSWEGDWPGVGFVQIGFSYGDAGRYGFRRIGPDKEARIFFRSNHPELAEVGLAISSVSIRLGFRSRLYANSNWLLSVDQWID